MPEEFAGDLRIGDTVWLFDPARRPPQSKRRVRAITVEDAGTHTHHGAATVPWAVVRSQAAAVKVDLDAEPVSAPGSQLFPCDETSGPSEAGVGRGQSTAAVVAVVAAGIAAAVLGVAILVKYGVLAFFLAQAVAAAALALARTLRRTTP